MDPTYYNEHKDAKGNHRGYRVNFPSRLLDKKTKESAQGYNARGHTQYARGIEVTEVRGGLVGGTYIQILPVNCSGEANIFISVPIEAVPALAEALLKTIEGPDEAIHHAPIQEARKFLESKITALQRLAALGVTKKS